MAVLIIGGIISANLDKAASIFAPLSAMISLILPKPALFKPSSILVTTLATPRTIAVFMLAKPVLIPAVESLAICSNDLRPPPPSLFNLIKAS